jgi:DNA-binding NarL/FixJ family response regulator
MTALRLHAAPLAGHAPLALIVIQALCIVMFLLDILYEVHLASAGGSNKAILNPVHLIAEGAALVLLLAGIVLAHLQLRHSRSRIEEKRRQLGSLRGQFDSVISERFHHWGLSAAESDIALLSLRGLKICEIATIRHTAEGTIKAQLSAVYRKSGMSSRTELLAQFMDEFLECSSKQLPEHQSAHQPAQRAA